MAAKIQQDEVRVRIDGLEASGEERERITWAVQQAVLGEIAQVDLAGPGRGYSVYFPREWLGYILRAEIEGLSEE